ncbi:hypothetical protein Emag_000474 [Eimeria magna]
MHVASSSILLSCILNKGTWKQQHQHNSRISSSRISCRSNSSSDSNNSSKKSSSNSSSSNSGSTAHA